MGSDLVLPYCLEQERLFLSKNEHNFAAFIVVKHKFMFLEHICVS